MGVVKTRGGAGDGEGKKTLKERKKEKRRLTAEQLAAAPPSIQPDNSAAAADYISKKNSRDVAIANTQKNLDQNRARLDILQQSAFLDHKEQAELQKLQEKVTQQSMSLVDLEKFNEKEARKASKRGIDVSTAASLDEDDDQQHDVVSKRRSKKRSLSMAQLANDNQAPHPKVPRATQPIHHFVQKQNAREVQMASLRRKIDRTQKELERFQETMSQSHKHLAELGRLRMQHASATKKMEENRAKNALEVDKAVKRGIIAATVGPIAEESAKSKKGKIFPDSQNMDDHPRESGSSATAAPEVIVIEDTPWRRHKKDKIDKNSQDSVIILDSIPIRSASILRPATPEPTSLKQNTQPRLTPVFDRRTGKYTMQPAVSIPLPDQNKQDALLATITRSGSRAVTEQPDPIYEALIAGARAYAAEKDLVTQAEQTAIAKSQSSQSHADLIKVCQAALAAPARERNTNPPSSGNTVSSSSSVNSASPACSPTPDPHKYVTPVPAPVFVAQRRKDGVILPPRRESVILPPKRILSIAAAAPKVLNNRDIVTKLTKRGAGATAGGTVQTDKTIKEAINAMAVDNAVVRDGTPTPEKGKDKKRRVSDGDVVRKEKATSNRKRMSEAAADHGNEDAQNEDDAVPRKRKKGKVMVEADWETGRGKVRARVAAGDDGEIEESAYSSFSDYACKADKHKDIAFSSSYLTSKPLGIMISGTKFQILSIESSSEQDLPVLTSGHMICSVAHGSIEVSIGGEVKRRKDDTKFTIGEGEMWRIRAAEKCAVMNRGEEVANIHTVGVE